ncbi:MAG: hypothetical protein AB4372_15005 [Xenococcus sp. (in: cyanobacteria)]
MQELDTQLEKANRLSAITQQLGFALWQLQELEGVCAKYYILVEKADFGMGEETGNALEQKAKKKTFGATIHKLVKAGLLTEDLEFRFKKLLSERNWLVHSSRASSRSSIHTDSHMVTLLQRLEKISNEALSLMTHVGTLMEEYVKKCGVSEEYIEKKSNEILEQWHSTDAI